MPVVFRDGAFRAFFYSNEGSPREPMHVHVRRGGAEAKLWLEAGQVTVAESHGFDARTLGDIVRMVAARRAVIEEAWHDHFAD
ncbi:MAG TPA: DUF4160 domain-containing protein [Hyphomicrobiales bacterium]|nr:DUF4160 domain-containing protein [Hyphomicrobiales bacterium]